jgi:putative aminopeptidase FrvX
VSAKEFLQKLSEASGVSGYERAVRDLVVAAFRPYADEITITPMGSVIALQRGTRDAKDSRPAPKVLIEGHMDEIGLMVTEIEKGFIRFTQVGGFDVRVLPAQQVVVHGRRDLPGVIGSRPPHVLPPEERERVMPMNELFVDVGLPEAELRATVQPGDLITIYRHMVSLKNNLVAGKAFDDRSAIVCLAEALRQLRTLQHSWDVYVVSNVQEEIGLRGATTSTFQVNPDVAIAIDVSHGDQPNTTEINAVPLGTGMGIATGPNIHPLVHERLVKTAIENEIPYRVTAYSGATGTDAWAIQVVREGIPTGLIDIPLRYMHTSVETVSINDLERIGRLLAAFSASLDDEFLTKLGGERNGVAETGTNGAKGTRAPTRGRSARSGRRS